MSRKMLIFLACSIVALAISPAFIHAQRGPGGPQGGPPFGGGPGGFGRGPGGFRVVGVEGCLNNGRPVPTGTPGFVATITHNHSEASFNNAAPSDHSSSELFYRDSTGVTFTQLTLPGIGQSKTPRTVICIDDPNVHARFVVNVNSDASKTKAIEYKYPDHKPRSNGGQPPQFKKGNGQPPPPNPNVTISNPPPPGAISGEISSFCTDAKTTLITRKAPNGTVTDERVYCPSLFTELYSQNSDSHSVNTTTVNITGATNSGGGNLGAPPIAYPLTIPVTVVDPGGKRRGRGPGGPPPTP